MVLSPRVGGAGRNGKFRSSSGYLQAALRTSCWELIVGNPHSRCVMQHTYSCPTLLQLAPMLEDKWYYSDLVI
jgi:hypothetical protein